MNISTQDKATDLGKVKYHLGKMDDDCTQYRRWIADKAKHVDEMQKTFEWSASNEKLRNIQFALEKACHALDEAAEESYNLKRELEWMLKYVGRE